MIASPRTTPNAKPSERSSVPTAEFFTDSAKRKLRKESGISTTRKIAA